MELAIETKQQLANLLANPSLVSDTHIDLLTDLVKAYPFYQPLHLLLAKAAENQPNHDQLLASASLYNGGQLTYQLMKTPEVFARKTVEPTLAITDEQEVFEEINELAPAAYMFVPSPTLADEVHTSNVPPVELPEELAIESIVSSDFFAFEQNFSTEAVITESVTVPQPEEYNQEAEAQSTVSKYNDDKLPYTFLWWLAKTRKEHEQIFQPYVTTKQPTTVKQGELQHQYVEHIFHLQTPFNVADEAKKGPIYLQSKPKGIDIIDSFIKNDPQIKPPKAEQINTENKAKKSAEDNYDLVSETLAAIYIEQMLYHKAIDTYEKLSLKFPEKSRYFADLIQSLEKKI